MVKDGQDQAARPQRVRDKAWVRCGASGEGLGSGGSDGGGHNRCTGDSAPRRCRRTNAPAARRLAAYLADSTSTVTEYGAKL
jgi:hypothetical protein